MSFLQQNWSRRWLRWPIWIAAALVSVYALLCAAVNWSSSRRWREVQSAVKAEGETLDFRALMSDPIPDEDNFCAIPALKDIALVVDGDETKGAPGLARRRLKAVALPTSSEFGPVSKGDGMVFCSRLDLEARAKWLRQQGSFPMPPDSGNAARDLLAALSKHDALVSEMAAALARPRAQFTPAWKTRELPPIRLATPLPHVPTVILINHMLSVRAISAARVGDPLKAHESARIIARLVQAVLDDPFIYGSVVGKSAASELAKVIWEICDARTGTTEDFAALETALAGIDLRASLLHAWRCEMASNAETLQYLNPAGGNGFASIERASDRNLLGGFVPYGLRRGFFDANNAVLADCTLVHAIRPLRDRGWLDALQSARQLNDAMSRNAADDLPSMLAHSDYVFASLFFGGSVSLSARAAYTQAVLNQAAIACALERFRIEKGAYPETLAAVKLAKGKPVPLDVMNGKPMSYRKTTNGKYTLWSVGFDAKDDDGERGHNLSYPSSEQPENPAYLGDWVWDFPAK